MTLRARILLSILLLSLGIATVLGLTVRSAWQNAEEQRFEAEYSAAVSELGNNLSDAASRLHQRLEPICSHDPIIDSALVGLLANNIDSRLLSLQARIPDLQQALNLSSLVLLSDEGKVLAGETSQDLTAQQWRLRVDEQLDAPSFQTSPHASFFAFCKKSDQGRWVALYGTLPLQPILDESSRGHDLKLELFDSSSAPPAQLSNYSREMSLPSLGQHSILASRSRQPLLANLRQLNFEIATAVLSTLAFAFLIALFLSRGLSRPITRFAAGTRKAAQGQAEKIPVSGGPELAQAAQAFNDTLDALAALRAQLVVTERIAARREVARKVAHEIKNPLSPIRSSIETLRKLHERKHPEFENYFEESTNIVLQEVARISNLVTHFATYAQLPSPQLSTVDLHELVQSVVFLQRESGVAIELKVGAPPKNLKQVYVVQADRDQIAQVLTNLIKNAVEASSESYEEGSHAPAIEVLITQTDAQRVSIEVQDRGCGVKDESELFEPYKTTKEGGTGLGLPISHRIAIEHGGDLAYRNREGGGACFTLSLPVQGPPRIDETN